MGDTVSKGEIQRMVDAAVRRALEGLKVKVTLSGRDLMVEIQHNSTRISYSTVKLPEYD